jgi:hypothetical protein
LSEAPPLGCQSKEDVNEEPHRTPALAGDATPAVPLGGAREQRGHSPAPGPQVRCNEKASWKLRPQALYLRANRVQFAVITAACGAVFWLFPHKHLFPVCLILPTSGESEKISEAHISAKKHWCGKTSRGLR